MKMMKFLLLGFLFIALGACDKEESADLSGDFAGTWKLSAYTSSGTTSVTGAGQTVEFSKGTSTGSAFNLITVIGASPAFVTSSGEFTVTEKSKLTGQPETTETSTDNEPLPNGPWARTGDNITFTGTDGATPVVGALKELSDNTLKIEITINEEAFGFLTKGKTNMTFTRQ